MTYYLLNGLVQAFQSPIDTAVFGGVEITEQEYNDVKNGTAWIANNAIQYPTPPTQAELLAQAKNAKRAQIEMAFNSAVNALPYTLDNIVVSYPMLPGGRTWNEAVALQAGLQGVPNEAVINQPLVGTDGVLVFDTAGEWRAFYSAMMIEYGVHATNRALKNQAIQAATTVEEVEGIVW